MLELCVLLVFFALVAVFTWSYGQHFLEKRYIADWKTLRSDWFLMLLLIAAATMSASGTFKLVAWLIEGTALLLGV